MWSSGPVVALAVGLVALAAACPVWAAGVGTREGGREIARGEVYSVVEIVFAGPACRASDAPARDVSFRVRFRHAGTNAAHDVHGFWDGDGRGGLAGGVFKVRFCPTAAGRWTLEKVRSSDGRLRGRHEGDYLTVAASKRKGFWLVDGGSPGGRWYRRSDGSHPYIFGNTHYTFLSMRKVGGASGSDIASDVKANAAYFKKLRFGIQGGRYVHPTEKPFLDDAGRPTDDGNYSHRPNPRWFHQRVDLAVRTAFECDLIADLILNGPDTAASRSVLLAGRSGGDNTPFLRYVAARYGSYPNVWFCLSNEWNIKRPRYTARQITEAGAALRKLLPYPSPISVHANSSDWSRALNTEASWNDHVIVQGKIRTLARSADFLSRNHRLGGGDRPVINDELGYEGRGDRFSRDDVIEGHLGALLGGGYGTTGFKPASKKGHYFWGAFRAEEHTAAAHLAWLRAAVDREVRFWKMRPVSPAMSIFSNAGSEARALAWPGREYLLGTNARREGITAKLPAGRWRVRRFDAIARKQATLADAAEGEFRFDVPASRAVLVHFRKVD